MSLLRHRVKRVYLSAMLAALAVALLAISMVSPALSTTTDFSIYNSGWNGTSGLAVSTYQAGKFTPSLRVESTGSDVSVVQLGLSDIDLDPASSALVVIGPTREFSDSEGEMVGDFVRSGGLLLLADDFGTGNSLLEGMNSSCRFSGSLLMDLAFDKRPEFSICFTFADDQLTADVDTILLNYPTTVTAADDADVDELAISSIASWLDSNSNKLQDVNEQRGPFPVMVRERLGQGSVILLSDPSVLINGMADQLDNAQLARNMLYELGALRTAVYFDESHRVYFDPLTITTRLTSDLGLNAKLAIMAAVFVLLLWVTTDIMDRAASAAIARLRRYIAAIMSLIWKRPVEAPKQSPGIEQLTDEVMSAHEDWRRGMVRYVLRERERHSRHPEPAPKQ